YGKYKYEANLKAREARKNQANTVQKEIRMGLKIDTHDYETKRRNVEKFLDGGDKDKVIIRFRGREQSRPEMGAQLLGRLAEDVPGARAVATPPRSAGGCWRWGPCWCRRQGRGAGAARRGRPARGWPGGRR